MGPRENPLRRDFPALSRQLDGRALVYLDNAATSLKPSAVIDAITEHYSTNGANIHRGRHRLSEEASDAYEAVRVAIADYIGVRAAEIVFVKNATEALNMVARGIRLRAEDTIVGCLDAHHSQILPWRGVATLHLTRVNDQGRIDLDHFRALLRLRPRIVALTHCSNVTGVLHPIAEMVREVRRVCDAEIVLDAAQSLPQERFDVGALDVDFVAFSGHKMFGPTGIGCLYGREARLEKLAPLSVGGGMVDWVSCDAHLERRLPHRLEAGTPPIASVIGFGAAIRYLEALDGPSRSRHGHELTRAMIEGVLARPYLRLIGPTDLECRHPIVSLRLPEGASAGEVARLLSDSYGIQRFLRYHVSQRVYVCSAAGPIFG